MSYNITNFRLKRLENLSIPLSSFNLSERKDWHPKIEYISESELLITGGCGQEIKGTKVGDSIVVEELDLCGEGSGYYMYYVLNECFKRSIGVLEATLIWEGGDSITSLLVENGKVIEKEIDL